MSQPTPVQPSATSFRPASGWQGDERAQQPAPRSSPPSGGVGVAAILCVAFWLIATQGIASTLSVAQPTPIQVLATIALWGTSGTVIAATFAIACRARALMLVAAGLAGLDALVLAVLIVLGAASGWDGVQLVPMVLAGAAAVLGSVPATERTALPIAAGSVALFYVTAAVVQALRFGVDATLLVTIARSMPIAVFVIAAAFALRHARSSVLSAVLLWALALALLGAPLLSALQGIPPVVASSIVLAVRVALVVVAGVLVLRTHR